MGLFDAIGNVRSAELGDVYTIKGEVICLNWEEDQPMLAEELFTALAQADTATGKGFCHADAGDTATKHYDKDRFNWPTIQQDTVVNSCFIANMAEEMDRIGALIDQDDEYKYWYAALQEIQTVKAALQSSFSDGEERTVDPPASQPATRDLTEAEKVEMETLKRKLEGLALIKQGVRLIKDNPE